MDSKKIISFLLLLIAAIFLGLVFSGALYVLFIKADWKQWEILTYWHARQYGEVEPSLLKKWSNAGKIGFGTTFFSAFFIFYKANFKPESMYGEARFADTWAIKRVGFMNENSTSLVVGKFQGKYLYYGGQQFAILAAPTRDRKSTRLNSSHVSQSRMPSSA